MAEPTARAHKKLKDRKILLRLLREIREEAGITQLQVAKAMGATQAYVSKYELGERRLDLRKIGRMQAFVSKYETGERRLAFLDLVLVCDALEFSIVEFSKNFDRRRHELE